MEKQRKQSESESGRRLLKKYIRFFLLSVFLFSTAAEAFSQTLTNAMLRELRISPVQDQQLAVNTELVERPWFNLFRRADCPAIFVWRGNELSKHLCR